MKIFLIENRVGTRAGAGLGMCSRPGVTDPGFEKFAIGALRVEKPVSLDDITSVPLFSLLSLVNSVDLDVVDLNT